MHKSHQNKNLHFLNEQARFARTYTKAMEIDLKDDLDTSDESRHVFEKPPSMPADAGGGVILKTPLVDPKGKRWIFVWNNYPRTAGNAVEVFFKARKANCWIYGKEIGDNNTPHLQGYVEFKSDRRFSTLAKFRNGGLHWERAKKNKQINADYCAKEGDWYSMGPIAPKEKLLDPLDGLSLHSWQKDLSEMCLKNCIPHSRFIYWMIGADGAEGKTSWAKSFIILHGERLGALYVSGKAQDMKHAIASRLKEGLIAPKVIILGIPRSKNPNAISYQGLEELKDGIFFSSKYESRMVVYNTPHVIVLANQGPAEGKLSKDRLKIWDLNFLIAQDKAIIDNDANMRSYFDMGDDIMSGSPSPPPPLKTRRQAMQEPELMDRLKIIQDSNEKKQDCPPWGQKED